MVSCINNLVFLMPKGILDQYDQLHHSGILLIGQSFDSLIMKVTPDNYNAANPVEKIVELGYKSPVATVRRNLYQFEAVDTDARSGVISYALNDLILSGGNLSVYGLENQNLSLCDEPLIAVEDYHELDDAQARSLSYTLRVGIVSVETLKGSWAIDDLNKARQGCRVVFTQTHVIKDGVLVGV